MSEAFPSPELPSSRARRRRARRMILPSDAEGREAILLTLSRRAYPTAEFFVLSLLCGAILGVGYLLDSPLILAFGALSAPLLMPWLGMLLATARGAIGFWLQTLAALFLSALLTFAASLISGWLLRALPPRTLTQAFYHARLWPADFVILALGALILVLSFVRSDEKPYLPSALLAYTLYLPISAAAIGLGGEIPELWPHGLLVALVRLAWASLLGTLVFYLLRFRPISLIGVFFSGGVLFGWLLVLGWAGGKWPSAQAALAEKPSPSPTAILAPPSASPSATPSLRASPTPFLASATPTTLSATPTFPFAPLTPSETPSPSETPTPTITAIPTPVYGRVSSPRGGGAYLREAPSFTARVLISLNNGTVVEVFPQDAKLVGNDTWLRVTVVINGRRLEGWMLSTVIEMPTPVPSWSPTVSLTPTPTP